MVVLDSGSSMVTIGNTQYLQPDYLSSIPTTVRIFFFFYKKIDFMREKINFKYKKDENSGKCYGISEINHKIKKPFKKNHRF